MAVGTTAFPTSLDTVVELVEITNNASSTLSGNVLIGDTTIGVTDIGEFPTTGFGTMVDDLTTPTKVEIISWTGKSGSNLTGCTRGTQGTSAAAFSSGNYIEVRPTAGHHEALRGAVIAIETKLGTGSTIAVNKLAALTASKAVVTDASGFLTSATTTAAEVGYLSGVTTPTGSGALVLATSPTLATPTIAKLANLTSNGFVKTSGGDGTLSVDTSTYLTANQTITLSGDVTGSGTTGITATIASGAVTYAKIQNISATQRVLGRNTAGAGSAEEVTLTQLLDWAGTAAQGDILYRGASGWALLPAGTNGHFLKTQGAAANPVWAAAGSGSGDVVGPGSATDNAVVRFDSTTGKLVQDSVVTIADTTGNMAGVGTLNTHTIPGGSADTFALLAASQSLTNKKLGSLTSNGFVKTSGGDGTLSVDTSTYLTANQTVTLSGDVTGSGSTAITTTIASAAVTYAKIQNISATSRILGRKTAAAGSVEECTLSDILDFVGSAAQGDILYRGASGWTRLGAGTSGHFLQTQGAGANPQWAAGGGGLTIGTTAITSGTVGRMLYEASGNVVGEAAGITYQTGASPTVTITAQAASYVGLKINSASTPSTDVFQVSSDNGTTTHFKVTSTGAPSAPIPGHAGSERYGAVTAYATTSTAAGAVLMGVAHNINVTGTLLNSVIMGRAVTMSGSSVANASVLIGSGTGITLTANRFLNDSVVIGQWTLQSQNYHGGSVMIGSGATGGEATTAQDSVFIGTVQNFSSGAGQTVIGATAAAYATGDTNGYSTIVGYGAKSPYGKTVVLGAGATSTAGAQFVSGSSSYPMTDVYFGKGVTNATPTAYAINGTGGSGSNIAGADINIAGGKGTGTGATGKVNLQIARPGSTGSTLNTLATAWSLNGTATSTDTTMTGGNGQTTVTGSLSESITLSTSGTTTDSTIDLPANSIILSVTGRVTTTITTATDWKLGDATIADRFSDANATLTAGTTTVGINQWKADRTTAGQGAFQQSTAKVRITTTGTPGAGVIRITIHYITLSAPTS